jgi:hypothetical protein
MQEPVKYAVGNDDVKGLLEAICELQTGGFQHAANFSILSIGVTELLANEFRDLHGLDDDAVVEVIYPCPDDLGLRAWMEGLVGNILAENDMDARLASADIPYQDDKWGVWVRVVFNNAHEPQVGGLGEGAEDAEIL